MTPDLKLSGAVELYSEAIAALDLGVVIYEAVDIGADFRILTMNPAALRISEVAGSDVVGKLLSEAFPGARDMGVTDALNRVLRSGKAEKLPALQYSDATQKTDLHHRWFQNDIYALADRRLMAVYSDVTDAKQADRDLGERVKELRGLYEIHRRSQTDTDLDQYAQHVCDELVRSMQAPADVRASLVIHGRTWCAGKDPCEGPRLRVPIGGEKKSPGSIEVTFSEATPPLPEELEFLKGTASSVSLWLSNRKALDNAITLERVLGSTDSEVALLNEHFVYQIVNPAYAARHGLTVSDITGQPIAKVLGDEYPSSGIEEKLKEAQQGNRVRFQQWRETPEGPRRIDVTFAPYSDTQVPRGVAVSIHDITPLHEAEAKLRRVAEVFSSSAEAVMMTELDGSIIDVNNAFTEITGYARNEAIGETPEIISSDQHSPQFFQEMFRIIDAQGRWQGEVWNRRKNGDHFPCLLTVSAVRDEKSRVTGYVASFSDITTIKQNEHRLELLARQDPLTGLPNRTHLRHTLDSRLARAAPGNRSTTILFIDLDQFKDVNDSLGHSAGDELLKVCSSRLLDSLRDDDILARVGGDEFVALLFDVPGYENVSTIASKLIAVLEEPIAIGGETVRVSASIGICRYPEDGADTETLLRNADTAMYAAKKAGRGTWECYSQAMTDVATRHLLLSGAFREALTANDLEIVYQPKYDADSLALTGFEALSRWTSPDFGNVSPEEFIAIAENNGLIVELDYKVLGGVCAQLSRWRAARLLPPKIAVNVSGRTLQQADFYQRLRDILEHHDVSGESLELELTETALLPQPEKQAGVLDQIRALGLTISIDDFGTGYSSLSYLQRLPVATLKIDASFVRELSVSKDADAIAEAIIAMARALDMGIVAEGVESEQQARFLRERGPMSVQGFLYSKAVSAQAATDMLPGDARHTDRGEALLSSQS
ncbi:EAL domain-containing protein [Congregibacter litoralis]|uniref:PAS domain protein S-box/diguanylate cyclase (GGDEF) domain protein n=1 Tax=Congregibacter litoralis KT71 TaxID=314285 RepID=A4A7X6_9GAMM|nr:EAL domain-containing protein [Congregibacter litoralis]EAQ97771.1 PAS domain protein S-box/diguanylate cyclase (GGDEF) domain protein [Congregibacter litoralis KT71]